MRFVVATDPPPPPRGDVITDFDEDSVEDGAPCGCCHRGRCKMPPIPFNDDALMVPMEDSATVIAIPIMGCRRRRVAILVSVMVMVACCCTWRNLFVCLVSVSEP